MYCSKCRQIVVVVYVKNTVEVYVHFIYVLVVSWAMLCFLFWLQCPYFPFHDIAMYASFQLSCNYLFRNKFTAEQHIFLWKIIWWTSRLPEVNSARLDLMVTRRFSEKMIKLVRNTMKNIEYRGGEKPDLA